MMINVLYARKKWRNKKTFFRINNNKRDKGKKFYLIPLSYKIIDWWNRRAFSKSDATKISTVFCFFVNKLTQTSNIISSKKTSPVEFLIPRDAECVKYGKFSINRLSTTDLISWKLLTGTKLLREIFLRGGNKNILCFSVLSKDLMIYTESSSVSSK